MKPRRRAPWWALACAASFVAYFALLVYCDVRRPESEGLEFDLRDHLVVKRVTAGSAAARAGLKAGDSILAVDGRPIGAQKMDWVAVATNVEFDRPILLEVRRQGAPVRLELMQRRESWSYWGRREGLDLLAIRTVQLATLVLALLVLFRRPDDPVARLGSWLLGSVGVFCVVLPFRIAAVWRGLWWPVGAVLWIPFVSSLLLGSVLLTFFLLFPVRRVRRPAVFLALWIPAVVCAAPFVRFQLATVYAPSASLGLWDGFALLLVASAVYLGFTVASAVWSYRRLHEETERRRLRVLLAGAMVGCPAAGAIVIGWWRTGTLTLFGARSMGWLFPLLVIVPLSFAYAILRHRLFDVRLIVRRGVQYALARRLLVSLVPVLVLGLLVDLYLHRDQPVGEVVATRASVYVLLTGAAIVAGFQRNRWLTALDRRFFRERYDAQRILRSVADGIREAGSVERVAGSVVAQVELALHPRFVSLLFRPAGGEWFRPLAAAPPGAGPERFPGNGKLTAIGRVLGRPLEISSRETGWLSGQLPADEVRAVHEVGLELLVPITTASEGPEAFLALGARRSEEPYAREDQDLLQAIASTLGLLISKEAGDGVQVLCFRECPDCGTCYDENEGKCETDGATLSAVRLPRVLVARYRLDRRLGRGGMGTVYSAADLALDRTVAVKVLREDLARDSDAMERFEREARVAASLSHPNVVTIHDFGVTGRGRGFLVMEYLQGHTLRAEMERLDAMPPDRVLHVLKGVCAAVDAAHRRQLVHRDLKPENVFLARVAGVEIPKVLDFGIAKEVAARGGERRETAMGVLLGTPDYMAPEQLRGEEAQASWDLWALAVVAYEMLTGAHPFAAAIDTHSSRGVPAAPTVGIREALSGFDSRWAAFFETALAVDPSRRPPTAAAFSAGLERILLP